MIVVPSVLIAWLKSIGIHDKKRDRYNQGLKFLIYRISAFIESIFAIENRLEEKSKKIEKCRRNITEISVTDRNIDVWGHVRVGKICWLFLVDISTIYKKYRRYIGDIFDISEIYRTLQVWLRFAMQKIRWPRFHPDLKGVPTVRFLIQWPEFKSKLDPTAVD